MARSLSLRLSWRWLLPLGWAGVQACSSRIDLPPRIGLGADGGGGASASSHLGGRGGVAGLTGLTVGGAPAAVFDAAGSGEGGDATSVVSGGRSGSGAAGAAGVPDPSADPAAAGVTGEGPPPECGALGSWVEGAALAISTPDSDRFVSITPDELTVAWVTNPDGVVTVHFADRTAENAAFDAPKSFLGAFAWDRAALSVDGLRLVLVNADQRGFTEYTRETRGDDFGAPGAGPFSAFEDYAKHGMPKGNAFAEPLLDADDKGFLYSEYGSGVRDTIHRSKRLFSGDPWSVGGALVATELQASGAQRRRPTGLSFDGRTLFFWDDVLTQERAGFFAFQSDSFSSFVDLGPLIDAEPNGACTRLYHAGPGASSLDLFVATAP